MILLRPDHLKQIVDAAETAYPREGCGLLVGRIGPGPSTEVTRIIPSANLAAEADRFEIDPGLYLRLQRELEGSAERLVGIYHSHPDHPAQPSRHDLEAAWDAELIWIIVGVQGGQAVQVTAHALDAGFRQFREIPLRTLDWTPYPSRETPFP